MIPAYPFCIRCNFLSISVVFWMLKRKIQPLRHIAWLDLIFISLYFHYKNIHIFLLQILNQSSGILF